MQGTILGQSSGSKINGIIEEYKVANEGNVNAGDFVKFIENNYGTDTQLSSEPYSGYRAIAIQLSNNKVFIAHKSSSNYQLSGTVCTIEGTTITVNIDTQLSNTRYSGSAISIIKLSDNKVFIAHSYNDNQQLFGMICTIEGTMITVNTDMQLSDAIYSGDVISIVKLSGNKVFIVHRHNNNYQLSGMICTIEETAITVNTDTILSNKTHSGLFSAIVKLSDNKAFIAHRYSDTSNIVYRNDMYN